MKQLLRSFVLDLLAHRKIFPTALTDRCEIQALLYKLFPVVSDKKLIRLGPGGDGGYLVPDDLSGIEACFSPGVSSCSGFERDCADLGMKVFLADGSVEKPPESHDQFYFTKKNVGVITNDDVMTIDDWVTSSLPQSQSDLVLQMDIEGNEYETILAISDGLMRRFRIIVIEFHCLEQLWNLPFYRLASNVFEKIIQTHTCVHIHPNNCCGLFNKWGLSIPPLAEFTFLRNDKISNPEYADTFPHILDSDNSNYPHFPLPKCWYGNNSKRPLK